MHLKMSAHFRNYCFKIYILIAFFFVAIADHRYQWFNVISHHKGDCVLALDAFYINPNCPRTPIVANHLEQNKLSQQWRINGTWLINRFNGLVAKVDRSGNLVFAHPTNEINQQFSINYDNRFIYANSDKNIDKVVQLTDGPNSLPGALTNVGKGAGPGFPHQLFSWLPVKIR